MRLVACRCRCEGRIRPAASRPGGGYVRCALRTGEIGPDLFRATLRHRITGASVNAAGPTVSGAPIEALGEGEGPEASGDGASDI